MVPGRWRQPLDALEERSLAHMERLRLLVTLMRLLRRELAQIDQALSGNHSQTMNGTVSSGFRLRASAEITSG